MTTKGRVALYVLAVTISACGPATDTSPTPVDPPPPPPPPTVQPIPEVQDRVSVASFAAFKGDQLDQCVDMAATPEPQTQGRWLGRLQGAVAPTLLWVDAAAFSQRFGHLPQRLAERRKAWLAFAAEHHLPCVFSDEDAAAALARGS